MSDSNHDNHSPSRGETTFGQDTDDYRIDPTSTDQTSNSEQPVHPIHEISTALQQDLFDGPLDDKIKGESLGWA